MHPMQLLKNNKLTNTGKKIRKSLTMILVYLTVAGAYTFTAFIIEEAEQQIIWGTWPAKDSGDYELVLEGTDLLKSLNSTLWWINWSIGYIQPLALLSYHSYWRSTDYYIRSLEAMVFAKSPESFDGRKVEFTFTPQKIVQEDGKIILVNRRIRVIVDKLPGGKLSKGKSIKISGIVRVKNNLVIIRSETDEHNRN
jgi:hypothetical protein